MGEIKRKFSLEEKLKILNEVANLSNCSRF